MKLIGQEKPQQQLEVQRLLQGKLERHGRAEELRDLLEETKREIKQLRGSTSTKKKQITQYKVGEGNELRLCFNGRRAITKTYTSRSQQQCYAARNR